MLKNEMSQSRPLSKASLPSGRGFYAMLPVTVWIKVRRLMTRFVSVFVAVALLNSAAYAACAEEDTLCLLRVIDEKMQENQLLLRQIERYKELDSNAQKQIELLTGSNRELATASKSALEAIQASRPRFYQTAEFGLAIGIPLGVIVTVLAAVAIGYAARQLLLGSALAAAP